ncbi:MAG TPA: serine/threonine-protein kinase, partial [Byssovorax sp.]
SFVVVALLAIRAIERGGYTPWFITVAGVLSGIMGVVVISYVGLFSAGAMVLSLGIFFFGMSHSRAAARATYAAIALPYLAATILFAADVVRDESLFSIARVPQFSRWYQVVMSQVVFATTFMLARSTRRATESAALAVRRFHVEIQKQDALLGEARGELDRVLRPSEGRHSGEVVGEFKLGDLLGKGGMGEVYSAEHVTSGTPAAVKLLQARLLDNAEHQQRFLREAAAAAAVTMPNVVRVFGTGATEGGMPYIAMEKLEGHDLGWHLRRTTRLSVNEVVELVDQAAAALEAMRAAGIVHRDLKPANLFATDTIPRTWKVLDFGLSKILGQATITKDQVIGTPSYMAPEQVRGKGVDHRADLYALGSLAYRTITGAPPFPAGQISHVLYKVLYAQPVSPASLVALPVDVELVLAVGMAKRPDDRFATALEFASALRAAAAGQLDDATRARGWALLREFPWGSQQKPPARKAS